MLSITNEDGFLQRLLVWVNKHLLTLLLVSFYLLEGYSKITRLLTKHYSDVPRAVKLACIALFIGVLLFRNWKKFTLYVIIPCIIFCLGQYALPVSFSREALVTLGKYLYPLLLFLVFSKERAHLLDIKTLMRTFEYVLVINSILIIIGAIFSIKYFQTYRAAGRFGYDGLIITSAAATYIYMIALFYFLTYSSKALLKNWRFYIIVLATFLLGTKSIYVSLFLIVAFLIYRGLPANKRNLLLGLALVTAGLVGYYVFYHVQFFSAIREEHGLLSALVSFRDQLFLERSLPYIKENWSTLNYLMGGLHDTGVRSQLSFADLFLFWGVIGSIWYLAAYYNSFVTFKRTNVATAFLIIILFIIALAGNFFFYATVPLYLLIFRARLFNMESSDSNLAE